MSELVRFSKKPDCRHERIVSDRHGNPGPENQMQQHSNSKRRRESQLLIGLAWLLKLGFLGRYQYIKNLLKKKEEGIRLQIFRFFGGWVWSEGKKKGRHGRIVSDHHGHPLVYYINCVVCASVCMSRFRFWVSGPRQTDRQDLFFFLFLFPPFSGGLPKVNTKVFFSFPFFALFRRAAQG
jgi:hypothetical protein